MPAEITIYEMSAFAWHKRTMGSCVPPAQALALMRETQRKLSNPMNDKPTPRRRSGSSWTRKLGTGLSIDGGVKSGTGASGQARFRNLPATFRTL
jgi:hypothetical protein